MGVLKIGSGNYASKQFNSIKDKIEKSAPEIEWNSPEFDFSWICEIHH